ncbi:MAG: YopX family protein [Nanoarchaeota archaeon]
MKREIEFRVWDTEIKRMAVWDMVLDCWERWIRGEDPKVIVMQYTGLHDKNGIGIYEGDIIKYPNKILALFESVRGEVIFSEGCFKVLRYFGKEKYRSAIIYEIPKSWYELEIIGNIYENPELLN